MYSKSMIFHRRLDSFKAEWRVKATVTDSKQAHTYIYLCTGQQKYILKD